MMDKDKLTIAIEYGKSAFESLGTYYFKSHLMGEPMSGEFWCGIGMEKLAKAVGFLGYDLVKRDEPASPEIEAPVPETPQMPPEDVRAGDPVEAPNNTEEDEQ